MSFSLEQLRDAPRHVTGERVILEMTCLAHAPLLLDLYRHSLPELTFIEWAREPWDLARAEERCHRSREAMDKEPAFLDYFAFERHSGMLVGTVDLHSFDDSVPRCQIGYVGDSRATGRGLMRDAVRQATNLAIHLGMQRIEAWCDARNHRSIHLVEQLGYVREGCLRNVERDPQGQLCDQVILALLPGRDVLG